MSFDVRCRKGKRNCSRGQAVVEIAFLIPLAMILLFGIYQFGRVFFLYQTLQKAVRGGAGLIAKTSNVNFCDPSDLAFVDVRNFIVYGNLEGAGTPIVQGLTPDLIQISAERTIPGSATVTDCICGQDTDSCDPTQGGRPPDFIVVNLGAGYQLDVQFPFVTLPPIPLKVSVRMAVTGG